MRVAWFSPMYTEDLAGLKKPPHDADLFACSRSCYASNLLLPELAQHLELELFHNGGECIFENGSVRLPVFNYLNAAARADVRPFDCFVYQVEDSPISAFCRHHLGLKPGIVWFHNLLLKTRGPDPLSHSPWEYVVDRVREKDYELPESDVWPETNEHYPRRETSLALASVFSQAWDHGEWRRRYAGSLVEPLRERLGLAPMHAPSGFIPLPVARCSAAGEAIVRKSASDVVVRIGFIGEVGAESRYHKLFAAVEGQKVEIRWYTASESVQLAQEIAAQYSPLRITVQALVAPRRFEQDLCGLCALVVTQFSLFGNGSPWVEIACASGVPTIVSDFGAAAYWAGPNLTRLPIGSDETVAIRDALQVACSHRRSKCYSEETSPGEIGREWFHFLKAHKDLLAELYRAWAEIEVESQRWVTHKLKCNWR